ncbi:LytTR family DNA-binding domain-containing protein [Rhizobium rhizosphaerae]|nr:LytTR family DNA-binding domain-containing protein [Xaviernesmea rhizosphaerae]
MKQPLLPSALREMQAVLRAPRFWGTFLTIVALFAVTGPYGTREMMQPAERLGYWLAVHAVTWTIAIGASILADLALKPHLEGPVLRMMLGSLLAALPIGLALVGLDALMRGVPPMLDNVLWRAAQALPLCALFCILTILTLRPEPERRSGGSLLDWPMAEQETAGKRPEQAAAASSPVSPSPALAPAAATSHAVPLLDRLKPEHRAALLRLSVQDHYTEIVTARGRELVLLRFSDALREVGGTPGLQVHRSHWVADAFVADLKREDGRLFVVTRDGGSLPVSRSFQESVRQRFARA